MAPKRLLHWVDPEKIDWGWLLCNPAAILILHEKMNWQFLSRNPAAIHLLEANLEKIDWKSLSLNPAIFEEIKPPPFKEELIQKVFEPRRVWRMGGFDWLEVV